jgi:hypothetical protein
MGHMISRLRARWRVRQMVRQIKRSLRREHIFDSDPERMRRALAARELGRVELGLCDYDEKVRRNLGMNSLHPEDEL